MLYRINAETGKQDEEVPFTICKGIEIFLGWPA